MNTEQLKTDRTALEILKFRMVERLRIDQPSWTEELCSKKVNDFLDEEDPNFGECFTTAMQDFASQESKIAVSEFKEKLKKQILRVSDSLYTSADHFKLSDHLNDLIDKL